MIYLYGTACLIVLIFRRGICHRSHDPSLFKIFLGLGKNIKNQRIHLPSMLNLPYLVETLKLSTKTCLPLRRKKTDNLLKYMSKKYSIFNFLPKIQQFTYFRVKSKDWESCSIKEFDKIDQANNLNSAIIFLINL